MNKIYLLFALLPLLLGCSVESDTKPNLTLENVRPAAKELFAEYADKNPNALDKGPCLGIIEQQWAIDIAHNPRTATDNDPVNQCEAYRTGQVKHLIEFNPQGQIITIK